MYSDSIIIAHKKNKTSETPCFAVTDMRHNTSSECWKENRWQPHNPRYIARCVCVWGTSPISPGRLVLSMSDEHTNLTWVLQPKNWPHMQQPIWEFYGHDADLHIALILLPDGHMWPPILLHPSPYAFFPRKNSEQFCELCGYDADLHTAMVLVSYGQVWPPVLPHQAPYALCPERHNSASLCYAKGQWGILS